MTVKELIDELLATCRNDGEQVVVQDSGLVTRVSTGKLPGTGEPAVFLNDYPREALSDDALPLCACVQYYGSHHPECPARRAYEAERKFYFLLADVAGIAVMAAPPPDHRVADAAMRRALARCALALWRQADIIRELSPTIDGKCYLDHIVNDACEALGCTAGELAKISESREHKGES